jgi:hypothetical protein
VSPEFIAEFGVCYGIRLEGHQYFPWHHGDDGLEFYDQASEGKQEDHMKNGFTRDNILPYLFLIILLSALSLYFVQPVSASGINRYVATSGTDDGDCTTPATPCKSVSYTIAQASSGDNIRIAAGTYHENLTPTKDLNLYGAGMDSTILHGSNIGIVILINGAYNISISDLTITRGNSAADGGGIAKYVGGSLTLTRVKITDNNAAGDGGGLFTYSNFTMTDCVVSANSASTYGGGIFIDGSASVTVNLINVTVSGNTSADKDGGIHCQNKGTTNMTNVTISGNTAHTTGAMDITGGGIVNMYNCTVANNSFTAGGSTSGIIIYGSTLNVRNTIISGPTPDSNCSLGTGGSIVSLGNNLETGTSCGFTGSGDLQGSNPALSALADNGGPTQTHALINNFPLIVSAAINAGTNTGCPAFDQRGMPRPQGVNCDIGSFEYSSCANKPTHIDGTSNYDYLIGEAYTTASGGQTIKMQTYQFSDALNLNQNKSVTLEGGYDCNYTANTGSYSTVYGYLTIGGSAGAVTIENILVK